MAIPKQTQTKTRGQQLADAYISIAKADHYMVGLVEPVSFEELNEAQQIIIIKQNLEFLSYDLYNLTLNLIEAKIRETR